MLQIRNPELKTSFFCAVLSTKSKILFLSCESNTITNKVINTVHGSFQNNQYEVELHVQYAHI